MGLSKKLNDSKTTAEEAELHKIMKRASYCCFKRCDFDLLNLLTTIVYNQDLISVINKEIYTRVLQSCCAVVLERLLNEIYYTMRSREKG